MDNKYADTYIDYSRIDKLNNLTNPETFWKDVAKLTKNITSISATKSWERLATIRYNELIGNENLFEKPNNKNPMLQQSTEDTALADIEKLIKDARTEQKILNNMMDKLYRKLDELSIDLEVLSKSENADCLGEAINCYIYYGEFSLKGLVEEIKEQYVVS